MEALTRAATKRSLRTIQTELDFLCDASVLTPAQVSQITAILPSVADARSNVRSPVPVALPPRSPMLDRNNDRAPQQKQQQPAHQPSPVPSPAPPSYDAHAPPPIGPGAGIATVSALYAYQSTDAGDLELAVGDHATVLEWMNADWARGRSHRTGAEGIFPRSYVKVIDGEKASAGPTPYAQPAASWPQQQQRQQQMPYHPAPQQPADSGYGNVPVEVAQGQNADPNQPGGKFNQQGKKFGKKLGNAAIFGAGATIGSNIVNGIL